MELLDIFEVNEYGEVTLGYTHGWTVKISAMLFNDRVSLTPSDSDGYYDYGWCFSATSDLEARRASTPETVEELFPMALAFLRLWDPQTEGEPPMAIRQAGQLRPGVARAPGEVAIGWND